MAPDRSKFFGLKPNGWAVVEIDTTLADAAHERLGDELAAANEELACANEELEAQTASLVEQARDLLEQKQLVEALLEHVPVAIAFLDTDLVYRRNNPAHSRRVGLSREAVIGRVYGELFPGKVSPLQAVAREVFHGIPFRELPALLERVLRTYLQMRTRGESFAGFTRRHSVGPPLPEASRFT